MQMGTALVGRCSGQAPPSWVQFSKEFKVMRAQPRQSAEKVVQARAAMQRPEAGTCMFSQTQGRGEAGQGGFIILLRTLLSPRK